MLDAKRLLRFWLLLVFFTATLLMLMSLVLGCSTKPTKTLVDTPYEEKTPSAPKPAPEPEPQPSGIPWNEARYHIGERTTVYGPVASTKWATGSRGQPTFINLGNEYPNTNRFTAIIWGQNRGNFSFAPESYYSGKTISVTGLIVDYEGVPEIEVTSPSQIQVW